MKLSKEQRWKNKRLGLITSSKCPDLMKSGRGNKKFGEKALNVLYGVSYERRTGVGRPEINAKSLEWGNENEFYAIEWLRDHMLNEIKSCSDDFEDIVFNTPISGFGDSPDAYIYGFDGNIEGVIEIKCPVSVEKIEKEISSDDITETHEYYWQLIAHLIGCPEAEYVMYMIYDGYYNDGKYIKIHRKDVIRDINKLTFRIKYCDAWINKGLNIEDINKQYGK